MTKIDEDYENFCKWYESQEKRFHCGLMNNKEVAYSAYLYGLKQKKIYPEIIAHETVGIVELNTQNRNLKDNERYV